jgi:TolB-like protein/Tfp pilus assembly protein PilF
MGLVAELRQRKLVQWTLAYVAGAFAVLQGVDIVAQRFAWPESITRALIIASVVGFFVTLLLAWYHGERGAQRVSGTELLLLALLLAIGGALLWKFAPGAAGTAPSAAEAALAGVDRRSIAVLPFDNMSGDKDNQYFSDGISEEILNVLAQLPGLKVAARTSSFSFRGGSKEIPQIARELQVRMVLEGSVRKQGDQVRITAQLIDAGNGFHVWSQTYDRKLEDIFAIQDVIARAIAAELKLKLDDTPRPASARAVDAQAYALYLKGMQKWQARGEANLLEADRLFRAALARDPKFPRAWSGLALTQAVLPEWSDVRREQAYPVASDAAERALALDPDQPEPYAVLSSIATAELRMDTSFALMERALAVSPSYATGYQWLSEQLADDGRLDEAMRAMEKGFALDPKSLVIRNGLANIRFNQGQYDEAIAQCAVILARQPDWANCRLIRFVSALIRHDHAGARAELRIMAAPRGEQARRFAERTMDALEGKSDADVVAAHLLAAPDGYLDSTAVSPFSPLETTLWFMALGRNDEAIRSLERYSDYLPHIVRGLVFSAPIAPLRCEPRFLALAQRLQVPASRRATLCRSHPGITP